MDTDNPAPDSDLFAPTIIASSQNGDKPAPDDTDLIRAELAEIKLQMSRMFEQTAWMCQIVAGVLNTLPPPMREQILKGMS